MPTTARLAAVSTISVSITTVLAAVFLASTLGLAYFGNLRPAAASGSVLEGVVVPAAPLTPAEQIPGSAETPAAAPAAAADVPPPVPATTALRGGAHQQHTQYYE